MSTPELLTALRQHFNYPAFRPGQAEALVHVMAGRDALVVMPTGSGKSIIYQLAALTLPGTALVISPLVALMKDQADSLTRRQLPATYINSSLSLEEQSRRVRGLKAGDYKLVLVAPERFRAAGFRSALEHITLSLFAVDEAHCISQWGHDFRPDYLNLAAIRAQLQPPITLALTATATPRVQEDILQQLGLPSAARVITGFNRPNLAFSVIATRTAEHKQTRLSELLGSFSGAGLIYTGTRREAEEVAALVKTRHRRQVACYHAGLPDAERARVQDAFLSGDLPLVVATNAFGMGIDRPDVRFVVHYTLPGTLEAYYQEAGRAGRDGLPAEAVLLYAARDSGLHKFFIDNASPTAGELRATHEQLKHLDEPVDWAGLERLTQLKETKLRVVVDQLETAGALERTDEAYGRLRLVARPLTAAALQKVEQSTLARQRQRYDLLERMVDYAQTMACRRRVLLRHFGDAAEVALTPRECCDNCVKRAARAAEAAPVPAAQAQNDDAPKRPPSNAPVPAEWASYSKAERAALIVLDAVRKLNSPLGKTKLAQLLHGSSSADVARFKTHLHFGKFGELRQSDVEHLVEQLLDSEHLQQVGGLYPVVQLTELGSAALANRAALSVTLAPPSARPRQVDGKTTLEQTLALAQRALNPEQIAAERGLAVGTIYSHLATLIGEGRVALNAVIPAPIQAKVEAAITAVGSAAYLAPLKAHLNDDTSYGEIRCVVEAWKRKNGEGGGDGKEGN